MKEIKAYVRISIVQEVVVALKREGFCCMTIIDVSGLGSLIDPEDWKYSMEFVDKMSRMAKIELVCSDAMADKAVEIIRQHGQTHHSGDGIIFVSPVERAVKIRTGIEGDAILQK